MAQRTVPIDDLDESETSQTATLCVWRIFGIARDWDDRPEPERSRQFTVTAGPSEGDQLSLTIGDIPEHVLDAIRDWRAQLPYNLNKLVGGYPGFTSAQ